MNMNNKLPKTGRKGTNEDGTRGERIAGVFPADMAEWLHQQGNKSATIVRCVMEAMQREKAMESTILASIGYLPESRNADNGGQTAGPPDC